MASPMQYRIREVAGSRGWTVKMLAKRANLDERRVELIASNMAKNVTMGTLERLAAAARVPFRDVLDERSLNEIPDVKDPYAID